MLHIFTSAAVNYIPKVRLLTDSIKKFHPEARIHLALADEKPANISLDMFDSVWSPADLGIDNWRSWVFGHAIVELATAIKPFVLEKLLTNDGDRVLYLDPDTVLYSRLDDVLSVLDQSSVALTPHQTIPETDWMAVLDNEVSSLKHGVYNLGFVAVAATETGRAFAAWWRERCYKLCIDDVPNGIFTDQRWVDLVPALFPNVAVLRTPRLNVSTWNLSKRRITRRDAQLFVNDEPLGFYHYTGFDRGAHRIAAQRYAVDSPVVFEMIDWYEKAIQVTASDPLSQNKWAFANFDNGMPISKLQRRVYRMRQDLQQAFPHPFASNSYLAWWNTTGKAEYEAVNQNISSAEHKMGVVALLGSKRSIWKALAQSLRSPALLRAYIGQVRHLIAERGLVGFLREIRSRI